MHDRVSRMPDAAGGRAHHAGRQLPRAGGVADVLLLQRLAGNRAVAGLVEDPVALQRATGEPTVQRDASIREQYGITGPEPRVPGVAALRAWPIARIAAEIERLTRAYGTQNAAALIRLRTAFVQHPSRRREAIDAEAPELDPVVAGGWDVWDVDASRYREYQRVYAPDRRPHGIVTIGEGTMEPTRAPEPNQPAPGHTPTATDPAGAGGDGATGQVVPQTVQQVCDLIGNVSDWTEVASILTDIATGGAELEGIAGSAVTVLEVAGTVTGVLALFAGAISTAIDIVEAFDTDLKIDQLMGFTYGLVYGAVSQAGPMQLPYSYGQQRSPAERRERWMAGVDLGHSRIGTAPALRDATARLRIAIHEHGEAAVLNAIWQRVSRRAFTHTGDVMTGYELSWPEPGVSGFH